MKHIFYLLPCINLIHGSINNLNKYLTNVEVKPSFNNDIITVLYIDTELNDIIIKCNNKEYILSDLSQSEVLTLMNNISVCNV